MSSFSDIIENDDDKKAVDGEESISWWIYGSIAAGVAAITAIVIPIAHTVSKKKREKEAREIAINRNKQNWSGPFYTGEEF